MKTIKTLLFLLPFWAFQSLHAQVVSTKEAFPNGENTITIIFDLKQAKDNRAAGLLGKTSDVYLWSGAGTTDDGTAFEYQPSGQTNFSVPFNAGKMTSLGNDVWSIFLKPRDYFAVPATKTIKKLGLLLKSGDGKSQTEDFVLSLYDGTLNLKVTQPDTKNIFEAGQNVPLKIFFSKRIDSVYIDILGVRTLFKNLDSLISNYKIPKPYIFVNPLLISISVFSGKENINQKIYLFVKPNLNIANLPPNIKDGINYINDNSVTLSLFAPKKSFVYVIGEFNNWQIDSKYLMNIVPDSSRYWLIINNLEKGNEYAFQYLIDGKLAVGDPYCEKILDPNNDKNISADTYPNLKSYPKENTYSGIVSVLQTAQTSYNWKIKNFKRPTDKDLVIYELLVRDFCGFSQVP